MAGVGTAATDAGGASSAMAGWVPPRRTPAGGQRDGGVGAAPAGAQWRVRRAAAGTDRSGRGVSAGTAGPAGEVWPVPPKGSYAAASWAAPMPLSSGCAAIQRT